MKKGNEGFVFRFFVKKAKMAVQIELPFCANLGDFFSCFLIAQEAGKGFLVKNAPKGKISIGRNFRELEVDGACSEEPWLFFAKYLGVSEKPEYQPFFAYLENNEGRKAENGFWQFINNCYRLWGCEEKTFQQVFLIAILAIKVQLLYPGEFSLSEIKRKFGLLSPELQSWFGALVQSVEDGCAVLRQEARQEIADRNGDKFLIFQSDNPFVISEQVKKNPQTDLIVQEFSDGHFVLANPSGGLLPELFRGLNVLENESGKVLNWDELSKPGVGPGKFWYLSPGRNLLSNGGPALPAMSRGKSDIVNFIEQWYNNIAFGEECPRTGAEHCTSSKKLPCREFKFGWTICRQIRQSVKD